MFSHLQEVVGQQRQHQEGGNRTFASSPRARQARSTNWSSPSLERDLVASMPVVSHVAVGSPEEKRKSSGRTSQPIAMRELLLDGDGNPNGIIMASRQAIP